MSDSMKRFHLNNDEDEELPFSSSGEEWLSSFNGKDSKKRKVAQRSFLRKIDRMSKSLSLDPTYALHGHIRAARSIMGTRQPLKLTFGQVSPKKSHKKFQAIRDVGRWKPSDDLLLLISVLQVNDLGVVFHATKFSCKFTYEEIMNRWNALLYNDLVSRTARAAIQKLHPGQQEAIHRRAPFSLAEEDLLCDLLSTDNPNLEDFENLLNQNPGIFYHARTAKSLKKHWELLKKYELLCDQRPTVKLCASEELPPCFSDVEENIDSLACEDLSLHEHVDQEIKLMDEQIKRKTRLLEDELGHWMQLLGTSTKTIDFNPRFDSRTFAILRGHRLKYAMQTRFISFGRLTVNEEDVDVDLSVEGPAHKVSRYQGGIELRDNGIFYTCNLGKRAFYVDGKPVSPEAMVPLKNNSVFEVFGITLVFLINKDLVEAVCFKGQDHE